MLQRLPRPVEIALFAILALICAAIVSVSPKQDSALFFSTVPLFLVCVMMGFRRNEQRAQVRLEEPAQIRDSLP